MKQKKLKNEANNRTDNLKHYLPKEAIFNEYKTGLFDCLTLLARRISSKNKKKDLRSLKSLINKIQKIKLEVDQFIFEDGLMVTNADRLNKIIEQNGFDKEIVFLEKIYKKAQGAELGVGRPRMPDELGVMFYFAIYVFAFTDEQLNEMGIFLYKDKSVSNKIDRRYGKGTFSKIPIPSPYSDGGPVVFDDVKNTRWLKTIKIESIKTTKKYIFRKFKILLKGKSSYEELTKADIIKVVPNYFKMMEVLNLNYWQPEHELDEEGI